MFVNWKKIKKDMVKKTKHELAYIVQKYFEIVPIFVVYPY